MGTLGRQPDRPPRSPDQRPGRNLLTAWDRYARLLDAQLASLDGETPDLDLFHELAGERVDVAEQIDAITGEISDSAPVDEALSGLRDRLETCRARDRAILARLAELRGDKAEAIRTLDTRRPGRDGYMAGLSAGTRSEGRIVDVKS